MDMAAEVAEVEVVGRCWQDEGKQKEKLQKEVCFFFSLSLSSHCCFLCIDSGRRRARPSGDSRGDSGRTRTRAFKRSTMLFFFFNRGVPSEKENGKRAHRWRECRAAGADR